MARRTGNPIQGTTLRWTFDEGPTKGMTFEHTFHDDGTVSYRSVDGREKSRSDSETADRPQYGHVRVSDDVHIVSYLAESGFTLTAALNFEDGHVYGFASNNDEWYPVSGTFETVDGATQRKAA